MFWVKIKNSHLVDISKIIWIVQRGDNEIHLRYDNNLYEDIAFNVQLDRDIEFKKLEELLIERNNNDRQTWG